MFRMGFFTGKIYDENVDVSTIKECCECINLGDVVLKNSDLMNEKRKRLRQECEGCYACEEAMK